MKNYWLLFLLLAICIASSTGCSPASEHDRNAWKKEHERKHMERVSAIIHDQVKHVKRYSREIRNVRALNCYSESKQNLLELMILGESEVRKCIENAESELIGDSCGYELQSKISADSGEIALKAARCIDNEL